MGRFTGGIPLVWVVGMLVGAGLTAAASVLLAYRVSPTVVVILPLVAVGFWVAQRHGAQMMRTIQKYGTYRHRVVGLLILLLLCIPLGRLTLAELGPVALSPVTALVGVVTVVWLWRVLTDSERIELSHMQLPLAIFLLWGIIGLYGAPDTDEGLKTLFIFIMGALVYLVLSHTVRSPEEAQGVLWAVAITTGIIGLYAALSGGTQETATTETTGNERGTTTLYYEEGTKSVTRSEGIFGHPNEEGGFLALCIPAIVALAASEKLLWRRALGYLLFTAAIIGLVFTYSRGAWFGTVVGLLVVLPMLKRSSWVVLGLLGLALMGATTLGGATLARLQSIVTAENDPAVTSREGIWNMALRLVEE